MRSLEADGMDMTADMIERQMRLRDARILSDRERHGKTSHSRYRFVTVTRDGGSLADEIVSTFLTARSSTSLPGTAM